LVGLQNPIFPIYIGKNIGCCDINIAAFDIISDASILISDASILYVPYFSHIFNAEKVKITNEKRGLYPGPHFHIFSEDSTAEVPEVFVSQIYIINMGDCSYSDIEESEQYEEYGECDYDEDYRTPAGSHRNRDHESGSYDSYDYDSYDGDGVQSSVVGHCSSQSYSSCDGCDSAVTGKKRQRGVLVVKKGTTSKFWRYSRRTCYYSRWYSRR
jgi:hypothetical protein